MARSSIELAEPLSADRLSAVTEMLGRSFDLQEVRHDGTSIGVVVGDDTTDEVLRRAVASILTVQGYAEAESIFRHEPAAWSGQDAQPALEARGDVRRLGPGLFAFSGAFLEVRSALDAAVRAIAARLGAQELAYPPLWPLAVLQGINYFHDFPQLALVASGVAEDFSARDAFARRMRRGSGSTTIACSGESDLAPARNALAPTVCDCCYWLLRGRSDVADGVFTVHGHVFRNESSPQGRMDRLTAYTMREVVLVGAEAFVLARREALVQEVGALLRQLDLRCSFDVADDPFFCNDALGKSILQTTSQLKYEARVQLFGTQSTAVGSFNFHADFFGRSYGYTAADGSVPSSACMGIGFERLAYALFCRHGTNPHAWPHTVRTTLGIG